MMPFDRKELSGDSELCKCGKPRGHAGWIECMRDEITAILQQPFARDGEQRGGFISNKVCPRCGQEFPG